MGKVDFFTHFNQPKRFENKFYDLIVIEDRHPTLLSLNNRSDFTTIDIEVTSYIHATYYYYYYYYTLLSGPSELFRTVYR